jgi:hypothetical protein
MAKAWRKSIAWRKWQPESTAGIGWRENIGNENSGESGENAAGGGVAIWRPLKAQPAQLWYRQCNQRKSSYQCPGVMCSGEIAYEGVNNAAEYALAARKMAVYARGESAKA